MKHIYKEFDDRPEEGIYLRVSIVGKSFHKTSRKFIFVNVFDAVEQERNKLFGTFGDDVSDAEREEKLIAFYKHLTETLKLSTFVRGRRDVNHMASEMESELFLEDMEIEDFKRYVSFKWDDVAAIGHYLFNIPPQRCLVILGPIYTKRPERKHKMIEAPAMKKASENNSLKNFLSFGKTPASTPSPPTNPPNIFPSLPNLSGNTTSTDDKSGSDNGGNVGGDDKNGGTSGNGAVNVIAKKNAIDVEGSWE